MSYRIRVIRSVMGNFFWQLFPAPKKEAIAESTRMFTRKENCLKITKKLARSLGKCKIEFLDLQKDYEE